MNWEGLLYIFGIPILSFFLDFGMRYLIRSEPCEFADLCYGADLALAGLTTGFASFPSMKHRHPELIGGVLILSFVCLFMTMAIHKRFDPELTADKAFYKWRARLAVGIGANFLGMIGMVIVLWLMWNPT